MPRLKSSIQKRTMRSVRQNWWQTVARARPGTASGLRPGGCRNVCWAQPPWPRSVPRAWSSRHREEFEPYATPSFNHARFKSIRKSCRPYAGKLISRIRLALILRVFLTCSGLSHGPLRPVQLSRNTSSGGGTPHGLPHNFSRAPFRHSYAMRTANMKSICNLPKKQCCPKINVESLLGVK